MQLRAKVVVFAGTASLEKVRFRLGHLCAALLVFVSVGTADAQCVGDPQVATYTVECN